MDKNDIKNPRNQSVSEENKAGGVDTPSNEKVLSNVKKKTIELIESGAYSKKQKRKKSTYSPPEILLPKDEEVETKKKYMGFGKYERRLKAARNVKSIMMGLSIAALTLGVLLLLFKLEVANIHPAIMAVAAACSFFVGFLPTFFLIRIDDKKIAQELDKRYGLKERAGTSVEYLENDSEMSILLRNDLREKLKKIDAKEIKAYKRMPLFVCIAILCLAVLITGVAYPRAEKEGNDEIDPDATVLFELTEEQKDRLYEIQTRVEGSNMENDAKEDVVAEIENLIIVLDNVAMSRKDALALIKLTTGKIDKITDDTGSQSEIYNALKKQDTKYTREFARLITKYDWERFLVKREDVRAIFVHKDAGSDVADLTQIKLETKRVLELSSSELLMALETSGVDKNDKLYSLLYKFTMENDPKHKQTDGDGLFGTSETAKEMEYLSYNWAQNRLNDLFSIVGEEIYRELDYQNQNYSVGFGAANDIRSIFGLQKVTREDNSKEEAEEDVDDKLPPEGADGGMGEGSVFGSDDAVYDKEHKSHVTYGDVIDKYYILMGNTEYTPEQKEMIQKYFETLFTGLEEKDED